MLKNTSMKLLRFYFLSCRKIDIKFTILAIFKWTVNFSLLFSHVSDSATARTVALQAPLSMGFPRQGGWSGLPFPFLGDLPDSGIKPASPALAGGFCITEPTGKPCTVY